jgi:hypothetical protein
VHFSCSLNLSQRTCRRQIELLPRPSSTSTIQQDKRLRFVLSEELNLGWNRLQARETLHGQIRNCAGQGR